MSSKYDFEYIVIGSGPAGSAAALNLAKAKKRVAMIEKGYFGGSAIGTRDIPYDVALNFSHIYAEALAAPELKNQDFSFNFATNALRQEQISLKLSQAHRKSCEAAGIICLKGSANLLDKHTVAVGKQKFTTKAFILATGSHLRVSDITGTDTVEYFTPESAIKIRRKPRAVMVVGGGSSGCEIATYFAELGVKVLIAEAGERLLPREDAEVSQSISQRLASQLGVTILPKCKVVAIENSGTVKRVIFRHGRSEKMVLVDYIVLATGSEPNLDYGLENAEVKYKPTGISANKYFETSAKNIYAIGDARGQDSSAEIADYDGNVLASNLLGKAKTIISYNGFARITKTHPEVAVIGLNEADLIQRKRKYKKAIIYFNELPIGQVENLTGCFVKLLTDRNYHIIGACIVAPNAELLTTEISLAIRHNLTVLELASTPHLINSYGYAIKLAARKLLEKSPHNKKKKKR